MAAQRKPEHKVFVILWALLVASACATHSPSDHSDVESIPDLDRTSPSGSFTYALSVLESKAGRKLTAKQRESVARALVVGEQEHGLSVVLSLAIIELESGFDPQARGPSGSVGLMQIQPATAREIAQQNGLAWQSQSTLLDPASNARIGLTYLATLRARFGTTEHAVAAYNIGPANLRRLLAKQPLRRGPYLTKVYAHVDALQAEFGTPAGD